MSALERPKSAWKSRSRTPHYTSWDGVSERSGGGSHSSVEPPSATSDSRPATTAIRRENVSLTEASGSLSDRHHRASEASRDGRVGRQRHVPETKTDVEDTEWATTTTKTKNVRQKKRPVVNDSLELSKRFDDVSKSLTSQVEVSRRDSASGSSATEEEMRRRTNSTQRRREKSWYDVGYNCDKWLKDDPLPKELRGGGGGGGGNGGGDGGVREDSRRLNVTAKPSKLAPLDFTRPSVGGALQDRTEPRFWMPERGQEYSLISVDNMGKRSDADRRNKLAPLPGLRKGTDMEKQPGQRHPRS